MEILKNLDKHNRKETVSFHMPGHKKGEAFKGTEFESKLWEYDTTELSDTDCLINPIDFIKKSEEKAAKIYGAEKSYFLVNGATCGILSMFYASFKEGDKVVIFGDDLPVTVLSDIVGTIPYEILTSVSNRVKRIYFQD